jgi:hypothetical protein
MHFDKAQAMSLTEIDEAFARAVAWQREAQDSRPARGR